MFVPRSPQAPEGDGWLLSLVTYPAENRADLLVLDAMNIASGPVARAEPPFNQPAAFHGCFVAA